jgi:hypothetical protein
MTFRDVTPALTANPALKTAYERRLPQRAKA